MAQQDATSLVQNNVGGAVRNILDSAHQASSGIIRSTISTTSKQLDLTDVTGIKHEVRYLGRQVSILGERLGFGLAIGLAAMGFFISIGNVAAAIIKERGGRFPSTLSDLFEPPGGDEGFDSDSDED